jgi:hypothetical protein
MRSPCSEVSGGNSPSSCAASTDKMVAMRGAVVTQRAGWLWGSKSEEGLDHYAHIFHQRKRIELS